MPITNQQIAGHAVLRQMYDDSYFPDHVVEAYVILNGTVLPIDRIAADRPYYSGKEKHHGMNVQVLADPTGRDAWSGSRTHCREPRTT